MRDRVLTWLRAGANATEGVQLLQGACAPSRVIRLARSNPVTNRRFMVQWLCRYAGIEDDYTCLAHDKAIVFIEHKPVSFREEFPFLNEPGCPPEFEILASRKFARYHAYTELHRKLRDCTSTLECASISRDLINNYLENRMIWDELNYYKVHRSVLGRHPIFAAYKRSKQIMAMSVKELLLRQSRLKNNIWRVQNEIKKGDKPHLELERKSRLQGYQSELAQIERLLDNTD